MSLSIDKLEALQRIDEVLKYVNNTLEESNEKIILSYDYPQMESNLVSQRNALLILKLKQTILDIAPEKSEYWLYTKSIKPPFLTNKIYELVGVLQSLRHDYANDFLKSFNEIINADIFTDILVQSEYLLSNGYFRASAVVAGVALESHIRKLAIKKSISITTAERKYINADALNGELRKSGIIDKTLNKSITSWLGLRNDAAHPDTMEINDGLIKLMIAGIRVFIEKYPA